MTEKIYAEFVQKLQEHHEKTDWEEWRAHEKKELSDSVEFHEKFMERIESTMKEVGFPPLPYRDMVQLVGEIVTCPGYAWTDWHRQLHGGKEYYEALRSVHKTICRGIRVVEEAYERCWLPADFYSRDPRGTFEAIRDSLFGMSSLVVLLDDKGKLIDPPPDSSELIQESILPIGPITKASPGSLWELVTAEFTVTIGLWEKGQLFREGLLYPDVFEEKVASGVVEDLGLLYQIGDESRSKDKRAEAFARLTTKYVSHLFGGG